MAVKKLYYTPLPHPKTTTLYTKPLHKKKAPNISTKTQLNYSSLPISKSTKSLIHSFSNDAILPKPPPPMDLQSVSKLFPAIRTPLAPLETWFSRHL